MKLIAKIVDAAACPGGKAIALCSEDGVPLPMQTEATLESRVGELGVLTVRFNVDGEDLRLA